MGLEWITRETTKKCFRWNPTGREARADERTTWRRSVETKLKRWD